MSLLELVMPWSIRMGEAGKPGLSPRRSETMTPQDDDYTGEKKSMGNDEDVRISMEIQWVCEACISKQIFVTTFMVFYDKSVYIY